MTTPGNTPVGFERWEPGAPWGDVIYSDGSRTSVHDPDGGIEAEAKQYGARYNAQPTPEPAPAAEPALTGAASPPLPPSTPSPPPAPPLPSGAPLTEAERAPLQPRPEELQTLRQSLPSTEQSPTARALADNGIDPAALPRRQPAPAAGAPGLGAPPPQGGPISPALAAVQAHAPQLVAQKGDVKYEGPDRQTATNVREAADASLLMKGRAITEGTQAKGQTLQDQAGQANQAYFEGMAAQQRTMGANAALQKARDQAASKLATAKATPIADHPDFPDWFVATSIFGALAGGFAEGYSGGRYKSTTLPMINELVTNWRETQRFNRSGLIDSLTQQLGDADAALLAGTSKLKDELAGIAEAKSRFARTTEGMRELKATADSLRAQALDDWGKAQTLVMGKESASLSMGAPEQGPGALNPIQARIRALGYTPEQYTKGLNGKVREGDTSPTIAQAATTTKQIDADIAMLQSIMAANGGTLPTKGVINIPQALIPTLARLGYTPGMQADQALALINTYVTQKAKSYGGVITESDRESAIKEMGSSGEGFIGALTRLRDANNNGVRTALSQQFPGAGQAMLDILLDDSASYGGIPSPPVVPFEKQNVEHTGPKEETFPETAAEKENREAVEKRQEARKELLERPEVKQQQEERERLPIGVRFSPF